MTPNNINIGFKSVVSAVSGISRHAPLVSLKVNAGATLLALGCVTVTVEKYGFDACFRFSRILPRLETNDA
jgi:hypothetical protein